MLCGQKQKRSFHSFRVKVALLRYIVFYYESGCDTSEPHVSYISRVCSSLVRQPYYAPNSFILKISGLVVVLTVRKVHWAGRVFYMDEYTLIFLFSQCMRCAQKRDCWESVRFASERSRVRIPLGPPICRIVLYDAAFFMPKKLWQTVPGSEPWSRMRTGWGHPCTFWKSIGFTLLSLNFAEFCGQAHRFYAPFSEIPSKISAPS